MNLKLVVRELIDRGMSREQIVENLKELGVGDAEGIYEQALSEGKAVKTQAQAPAPRAPFSPSNIFAPAQKREESPMEEFKPSQEDAYKPRQQPPQRRGERQQPEGLMEEISAQQTQAQPRKQEPKILFPTIIHEGPEGEEKEMVGPKEEEREKFESRQLEESEARAGPEETPEQLEKRLQQFEQLPPGSLEEKIDETIVLLKALKSLNKQILETDRKVLLRLK